MSAVSRAAVSRFAEYVELLQANKVEALTVGNCQHSVSAVFFVTYLFHFFKRRGRDHSLCHLERHDVDLLLLSVENFSTVGIELANDAMRTQGAAKRQ